MELLELLLTRVDPLTAMLLMIFIARQRRPAKLLAAHLVKHHDHEAKAAATFLEEAGK